MSGEDIDAEARKIAIEKLLEKLPRVGVEQHAGIRKQIALLRAGLPTSARADHPVPSPVSEPLPETGAELRRAALATDKKLLAGVLRAEEYLAERAAINEQLSALMSVLKAQGYDPKTVRQVIKRRAMEPADRVAADELLEAYECALGMGPDLDAPVTLDARLAAKLLPSPERKAPTLKQRHAIDAVALAAVSRMNRGLTG